MNLPKAGWHFSYCKCGKAASTTTHFGGKNKLKKCSYCADVQCIDCFIKSAEKKPPPAHGKEE